jgi:flavodoxin
MIIFISTIHEAEEDQKNQARPELKDSPPNLDNYQVIILGYPTWWYTFPMPVATFLEKYDFKGKTIAPFVSHGGGGVARGLTDMAKLCPGATILEVLAVSGGGGSSLGKNIDAWLAKIGLGK